jgi:hypothetical protein
MLLAILNKEMQVKKKHLELEYGQINDNFRFLAEVRLKPLALVSPLGAVAVSRSPTPDWRQVH